MATASTCFHCALPVPADCDLTVTIEAVDRPVCCPGCRAVAELIRDSGMNSYYALRDAPSPGTGRPPEELPEWQIFNSDEMLQTFADRQGDAATTTIYAGGMYCSACSWLIENSLQKVDGVQAVAINPITHRVRVTFAAASLGLGDLLARIAALGYQPKLLAPEDPARPEVVEQRATLKRLLVASLGMMQAMMFAVGLYAGDYQGIDTDMQRFLRLVSFFVTTPVVFYSARPFFAGARRGLLAGRPGMDLPVSLAIGLAYVASVYSTFTNGAAVWYDSVAMFVFFLTLGRYLEMRARHRSIDRGIALSQVVPNTATRVAQDGHKTVPVAGLIAGDVVMIRAGDPVPADGIVVDGSTSVDESLLTGESRPQARGVGDRMTAGSVNLESPVSLQVEHVGADTALGVIARLSEQARYARPAFVQTADRIASYIVVALLVVAAVVAAYWSFAAPERAFVITLSVLVVTCPCALALATPAAFATAGSRLAERQLLLTNGDAIEVLAEIDHVIFDKTGTLTTGNPVLTEVRTLGGDYGEEQCLRIAAALEQYSSHPIASAFSPQGDLPAVEDGNVHIARGVSGTIDGATWRIGSAEFAGIDEHSDSDETRIYLSCDGIGVARFALSDQIRSAAADVIAYLRRHNIGVSLASGDSPGAVRHVADQLGIDDMHAACSPQDKLALIESRQQSGLSVVMVGDGINDAPVLAGADTSIAPAHGALLAQTNADLILLGESLLPVETAHRMARKTMQVVRQNIAWAIAYNLLALPLAAAGFVPPWAAAIGMSASSLVVVLNALRLSRYT